MQWFSSVQLNPYYFSLYGDHCRACTSTVRHPAYTTYWRFHTMQLYPRNGYNIQASDLNKLTNSYIQDLLCWPVHACMHGARTYRPGNSNRTLRYTRFPTHCVARRESKYACMSTAYSYIAV